MVIFTISSSISYFSEKKINVSISNKSELQNTCLTVWVPTCKMLSNLSTSKMTFSCQTCNQALLYPLWWHQDFTHPGSTLRFEYPLGILFQCFHSTVPAGGTSFLDAFIVTQGNRCDANFCCSCLIHASTIDLGFIFRTWATTFSTHSCCAPSAKL